MIRFLKITKVNSDHEIDLCSFDINAICYNIDPVKYLYLSNFDLVQVLYTQLKSICTNQELSDKITSVDGREHIFKYNSGKLLQVKSLLTEVEAVYYDLAHQNVLA